MKLVFSILALYFPNKNCFPALECVLGDRPLFVYSDVITPILFLKSANYDTLRM
jgi:hypothetical protein